MGVVVLEKVGHIMGGDLLVGVCGCGGCRLLGFWAFGPWSIEFVLKDHLTNQSQIPPLW